MAYSDNDKQKAFDLLCDIQRYRDENLTCHPLKKGLDSMFLFFIENNTSNSLEVTTYQFFSNLIKESDKMFDPKN